MNLTLLILLFCGLTVAQDVHENVTEKTETQPFFPSDMCDLQRKIGAMKEQLAALANRQNNSEKRIEDLERKVIFSAATDGSGAVGPFNTDTILMQGFPKLISLFPHFVSTGVFTTSVSGTYYFTFFYHAGRDTQQLYVSTKMSSLLHEAMITKGGMMGLIMEGTVFVRLLAHTHIWAKNHITTFSGF
uniref:C1q domain-containing protein n=1 Tax=Sphaeramia orbicularis TaxID=375764 RepID=A0A673BE78_9TELE